MLYTIAPMATSRMLLGVYTLLLVNGVLTQDANRLILFLLDGMRWDLFGLDLPELRKVEKTGVKADWMNPVFYTMSLPNMFSIATGLYPESHGVIHNVAFNVSTQLTFRYQDTLYATEWFNQGNAEPIWVTAINKGLKAGLAMYPGFVEINGVLPTKWINFPVDIEGRYFWKDNPARSNIDEAVSWLKDDDFSLAFIYSPTPDFALHQYGIGNERSINYILETSRNVGYLFERLKSEGLADVTNVIIVGDHGHIQNNSSKCISIYDYVDPGDIQVLINYGPLFQLEPKEGLLWKVFQALHGAHPNLNVFKREDFPERFHYANNPRNLKIIGYADPPWMVYSNSSGKKIKGSAHGWDNEEKELKSIFYAKGPSFRKGYKHRSIDSINIYMLMCELLGLEPLPNNGSRANYVDMLGNNTSHVTMVTASKLTLIIACTFGILLQL